MAVVDISTSRFNGTVQMGKFRAVSAEYENRVRQPGADRAIRLRDDLSEESFNAILRYVEEGDTGCITVENLADFWKFAMDWNAEPLYEYLKVWIGEEGVDVTALEFLRDGSDELEKKLQQTLVQQVKNPVFLACVRDIGLDTVRRIFEMNGNEVVRLHQHDLVPFMMKCLDLFGDEAWVLFKAVDFNQFTVRDVVLYSMHPKHYAGRRALLIKIFIVTCRKWGVAMLMMIVFVFLLSLWRKRREEG